MNPPAQTERRPLSPGTVLANRFEICEFLGAGSFGEVYRAKQLLFGRSFRNVALKLFAEGVVTSQNAGDVLNDALVVFGLIDENPSLDIAAHLVQVYDMGIVQTPAARAFMSMRLIPGKKTLKSEVYRFRHAGGMPVSLSLRYMRELLLPLAWMHSLDTPAVHGDLKPENVMLTEDSHLVVVDFGLAARMPIGVRGGTIAYDAPEKLLNIPDMPGGPAADVYSVGVIWYELLTGKHPFNNVGLEATAKGDSEGYVQAHLAARKWPICSRDKLPVAQQQNRIVPASEVNQDLAEQHPQVELLLNKCLADDMSERFSNARLLFDDIMEYVNTPGYFPQSDLDVIFAREPAKAKPVVPRPGGGMPPPAPPPKSSQPQKTSEGRLADAAALVMQGKPEQAIAIADGVLRDAPNSVPALLAKAEALLTIHDRLVDADAVCGKAMAVEPKNPAVFLVLAKIREAQGKRTQAAGFRATAEELKRAKHTSSGRTY